MNAVVPFTTLLMATLSGIPRSPWPDRVSERGNQGPDGTQGRQASRRTALPSSSLYRSVARASPSGISVPCGVHDFWRKRCGRMLGDDPTLHRRYNIVTDKAPATLGARLRQLRLGRYTQRELANLVGLNATYVSKIEHDADRPGEDAIRRLAAALGAEADELLALAGIAPSDLHREALADPRLGDLIRRMPSMGSARRSAVFAAGGVGSHSALLVDGSDLEAWAQRRDSQALLPRVVQRLILDTGVGVRRAEFRSGDGINFPGWDGLVDVTVASAFIPAGTSGWELGTSRQPKRKADADFASRTSAPGGVDPATSTFVFVTPTRWASKNAWATERRRASPWRDVRVVDADDLAAWLAQAPAVHAWLSTVLGKLPEGARSLEFAWRDWSEACSPPLSIDLTLAGRGNAADEVRASLLSGPGVHMIRGDSPDEVIAFVAATVQTMDPMTQAQTLGRTVVCDTPEAWRRLTGPSGPLVLVAPFTAADAAQAAANGHVVLLASGRDVVGTGAIELPRPRRQPVRDALQKMFESSSPAGGGRRVEDLASIGRLSLLALRRRLAISPALNLPAWATGDNSRQLMPLMLAGGWREDVDGDLRLISDLAGRPYGEVAAYCAWLSTRPDPPLRRDGPAWLVASAEDLWALLGPILTAADASALGRAVQAVLGTQDPALEVPRAERWMAGVRGLVRPHSNLLRDGLAGSVLLLAVRPTSVAGVDPQVRADGIVANLLASANADPSGRLWSSLGDVMPTLAEAAPERFHEAVDRGLSGPEPVLARLFTMTADEPVLSPGPETTGLLWALETLAWHPEYLARVALALARLDGLDPGVGNWSNRPSNSLRTIFLPWHPGTTADLRQRLAVLDLLRRRSPDTAWKLIIELLPKLHDVATPSRGPTRRDWQLGSDRGAITYAEIFESADELAERLSGDAGSDAARWSDVVGSLDSLPPSSRSLLLDRLEMTTFVPDGSAAAFGETLRDLVANHRRADGAQWRLPDTDLDRLESVAREVQTQDPMKSVAWLFAPRPPLPIPLSQGHEAYEASLTALRTEAVLQLLRSGGVSAIESLASEVKDPFGLGFAIGAQVIDPDDDLRMVDGLLDGGGPRSLMGTGYIAGRHYHDGWTWTNATLERIRGPWQPSELGRFLAALQPTRAVWTWAERLGEATEAAYWKQLAPRSLEEPGDVAYAAAKLLMVGRGIVAVDLLSAHLEHLRHPDSATVVVDALRMAATDPTAERANTGMLGWDVARLLDFLERGNESLIGAVAELEFSYLPLLRHGDRPAKVLHRQLATQPEFFAEVLRVVFRGDDEEARALSDQEQVRARLAFELLHSWKRPPGLSENGEFDGTVLRDWVLLARHLAAETHRAAIGAQQIGSVLRYVPAGPDGVWPPEPVRDLIEELEDGELELGLQIEIRNSRGVTVRGPTDGGQQEREIAERFRADARALQDAWPRTSVMLSQIAESYELEARKADDDAALTEDTRF
jgi:transcriptional regulator with XRE-family HTH domain